MLHQSRFHKDLAAKAEDSQRFGALQRMSIGELFAAAERLANDGEMQGAANLYKNWIACNPGHPVLHAAYFNYGVALAKAGDRLGGVSATREGIRLKPDFYPPYINLGRLLEDAGQVGAAIQQWLALTGRLPEVNGESVRAKLSALQQLGRVLESHQMDAAAEDALKQSLDISLHQPEVVQHWLALRQRQCKWPVVAASEHAPARALLAEISPLSLANLIDDPVFQLARAWKYNRDFIKPVADRAALPVHVPALRKGREKLRIGYVSSDLREHAVGFAMTDVFETHDRDQFEIHAYYCGIERMDSTRLRILNCVDHWVDINGLSDEEAAARIAADEIDILVDLNGYTKDARTRVFSLRPAPITVNWFGFPGTMGSPYHHYLIADPHVVPEGDEIYYSEKVVRLECYQPNDRKRRVSAEPPSRAAEGLPEGAFVYCCLNGMQKITPEIFAAWMSILREVPGAVLWLLGATDDTNARLRGLAQQAGVAPERLIFAAKKANPEHVARYALADVFLDTFPYGAHTTAADAMWMGVPIVTRSGNSFASRVCAGLVQAAGIGELVCTDAAAYVEQAIELGRDKRRVAALRQKLIDGRTTSLLFDTPKLVRDLEGLYRGMWADYQAGRRPAPDLANLGTYHEVALDLHSRGPAPAGPDLRERYRAELALCDAVDPLRSDPRLWKPRASLVG